MAELRDLESDRRLCDRLMPHDGEAVVAFRAALDEIGRLKRLLVWQSIDDSWTGTIAPYMMSGDHLTEADAWAAVRKAANRER